MSESTQNTPKTESPEREKLLPKQQIIAASLTAGIPVKTIATALNYHPNHIYGDKKRLEKWSLMAPKIVKKAKIAVEQTLDMVSLNDSPVRVSDRLRAAELVYNRAEPAVQRVESVSVNMDYTEVDMADYLRGKSGNTT